MHIIKSQERKIEERGKRKRKNGQREEGRKNMNMDKEIKVKLEG